MNRPFRDRLAALDAAARREALQSIAEFNQANLAGFWQARSGQSEHADVREELTTNQDLYRTAWAMVCERRDAEELHAFRPDSFARVEALRRAQPSMGNQLPSPDIIFEWRDETRREITARAGAPTTLWWFIVVLGRGTPLRVPPQFFADDGTPCAVRWGPRSSPRIALGTGDGGILLAFCGSENFLDDRVASEGLVEILRASARHVVLIKKTIRDPT